MLNRSRPVQKEGRSTTRRMDHITGYLMILPSFVLLLIFVIIPLFMALQMSFTTWSFYGESEFVWFKNYRLILLNELFLRSIRNIIKYILLIIPTQIIFAFLFAHILMELPEKTGSIVKTSIYVPNVISGVVASVIFLFILNYRAGLLNEISRKLGFGRIAMLTDPTLALLAVCIPAIWLGFGYTSLVMYAGMNNIPQTYYEAASIDGAGAWIKMTRITIPCLKNIFVLILISMMTGTLQMFDLPYMMTGGGPTNATLTPMMFLYNNFKNQSVNMGYTLAGALLMMIVIGSINSVVFTILRSERSLEG
ncbi:MAG: sugar ABC transporter permease [Clostridia bacterium]|nr:sugar ABC transporter permease [Clostridia bacterium]